MYQLSMEISDYYTSKDHFMVEDLFNFSNDETALDGAEANVAFDTINGDSTDSSSTVTPGNGDGSSASGYGQHFSTDFYQPEIGWLKLMFTQCEEVAELEWLSNFMEDCFSNKDHPKPPYQLSTNTANSSSSNQVPAKSARSKRSRANPTNWASRIPTLTPSESTPNSMEAASEGSRRCMHCGSDKTPQWRMGPMGPKTLCNACGVRYKSGRLVPEYRPVASPSFVGSEHSNSHRKVVELRRQKELMQKQQQQQMLFWS